MSLTAHIVLLGSIAGGLIIFSCVWNYLVLRAIHRRHASPWNRRK